MHYVRNLWFTSYFIICKNSVSKMYYLGFFKFCNWNVSIRQNEFWKNVSLSQWRCCCYYGLAKNDSNAKPPEEWLFWSWHCLKHLHVLAHFIFITSLWGRFRVMDEETEAQRNEVACPTLNPGSLAPGFTGLPITNKHSSWWPRRQRKEKPGKGPSENWRLA